MSRDSTYEPLVTVVGFHHARSVTQVIFNIPYSQLHSRGPEIETWFGAKGGIDPAIENDWTLLPFMALSDGAHTFVP